MNDQVEDRQRSPAHEILELLQSELAAAAPFFRTGERNERLRPGIIRRLVAELMTDDERAAYLGLGEGCRVRENAKIISPEKLVCGKYVNVGEGSILDASGGLEIGDHTSIGLYVMVWTHSSHLANLTLRNVPGSTLITRKPTRIGRGCFLAGHSVVLPGVTIGDRTMVLPGSVVANDVEGGCIVAGAPAQKFTSWADMVRPQS